MERERDKAKTAAAEATSAATSLDKRLERASEDNKNLATELEQAATEGAELEQELRARATDATAAQQELCQSPRRVRGAGESVELTVLRAEKAAREKLDDTIRSLSDEKSAPQQRIVVC